MDREKAEEEDCGQEEEGEEMKSERKGSERVIWKQEAGWRKKMMKGDHPPQIGFIRLIKFSIID